MGDSTLSIKNITSIFLPCYKKMKENQLCFRMMRLIPPLLQLLKVCSGMSGTILVKLTTPTKQNSNPQFHSFTEDEFGEDGYLADAWRRNIQVVVDQDGDGLIELSSEVVTQ